jgi:hypothetical protein
MKANGYKIYKTIKSNMLSAFKRSARTSGTKAMKKQMRAPGFADEIIREMFRNPAIYQTLDAAIMMDEFGWQDRGGEILFPDSQLLLEMLWRSKMKVELDSLAEFPLSFVVSWPEETVINGKELPPVLVTYMSFNDRNRVFEKFRDKYLQNSTERALDDGVDPDEKSLHIVYLDEDQRGPNGEPMYVRCSIKSSDVQALLKSSDVLHDVGSYGDYAMMYKLTDEEVELQWTIARMVLNLLVYMQACPDTVVPGWPDKVKERNFTTKHNPQAKATFIGCPQGTHASPDAHWRNAHFRSYPKRKDGSRQQGVVFVSGCIVNADVDPYTVLKSKKIS